MNAIFTDQTTAATSDAVTVYDKAMFGCNIEGNQQLIVLRETLSGEYKPLTSNGKSVYLDKDNNEICLQGPKSYKLQFAGNPTAVSAWSEE